jgi:putative IMPACT (imprinted ancient) family translation regulator
MPTYLSARTSAASVPDDAPSRLAAGSWQLSADNDQGTAQTQRSAGSPCYSASVRVAQASEFALTIERSRFHALLAPLAAAGEMEPLLKARRRDYRRANHHCWACRVRDAAGAVIELSKDDGEVGHPGRVLLDLLKKHDLEGALVVSRIFGGVKLGVGGVSRAFRDAGQGAINRMAQGSGPKAQG